MQVRMKVLGVVLLTSATSMFAQTNTFPTTGNVGIGTTNPGSLLHLSGPQASLNDSATTLRLEYPGGAAIGSYGPGITFAQQWYSAIPASTARTGAISGVKTFADSAFGGGLAFFFQPNASPANLTEGIRLDGWGNVGIGTTGPGTKLEVNGSVKLTAGSGASIIFADGSIQTSASMSGSSVYSSSNGKVGIGTTSPAGALDVASVGGGGLVVAGQNLDPIVGYPLTPLQNSGKLLIGWNRSAGAGETDFVANSAAGSPGGYTFYTYSNAGQLNPLVAFNGSGNVGIGTTTPGAKLEVNGNVLLTAGSGASMTFPDGTVQATAWNGTTLGGDYAESVDVQGERARYEPGDVIVIDASSPGRFGRSQVPYSKLVAGVYSTKPGLVGRRTTAERPNKDAEVPMAMMGIVPTKVTTENGPIEPGDLLVSSSTAGYAMKGTDRDRLMGTVIGKALSPMKSGNGVIEVLLAFQ